MAGGQVSTLSAGDVGKSITLALVGAAIALSQGTIAPRYPGQFATLSQGSATASTTVLLTGSVGTLSQGAATPNSDGIVPLTGSEIAVAQGAFVLSWGQDLAGIASTSDHGALSVVLRPTDPVGQGITSGRGIVSAEGEAVTAHLSGDEATFGQGFVDGGSQFPTGSEATSAAGSPTWGTELPITGIASSCFAGLISPEQDAVETLILSVIGAATQSSAVTLTGAAISGEQGSVSVTGDSTAALTGLQTTSQTGTIGFDESFPITGQEFASAQYPMGAPGGASLTGAEATVIAGQAFTTNDRDFALSGLSSTVQDGAMFASPLAFVSGAELTSSAQEIGPREVMLVGAEVFAVSGILELPRENEPRPGGFISGDRRRNYIVKGKRYYDLTDQELAVVLATMDVEREDVQVSVGKKKPHVISKATWDAVKPPEDDFEAEMLLL